MSEDLDSVEATTEIEVTSPARPWLGTVRLADDGTIEWDCDWRAAFRDDPTRPDARTGLNGALCGSSSAQRRSSRRSRSWSHCPRLMPSR